MSPELQVKVNLMGLYWLMMKPVKMKMEKVLQKNTYIILSWFPTLGFVAFLSNFLVLDMLTWGRWCPFSSFAREAVHILFNVIGAIIKQFAEHENANSPCYIHLH